MASRWLLAAVAMLSSLDSPTVRSAVLQPPSLAMHGSTNTIAAGELIRIDTTGVLVFRALEPLHALRDIPAEVAVRVPTWVTERVAVGGHYVIAYTDYTADPRRPRSVMLDPAGPRLLVSVGLEPALFPDTPQTRSLFTDYPDATAVGAEYRTQVITGLEDADPQLQRYFAAELALRPSLAATLRPADRARVRAFVADIDAPASARALLLSSTLHLPKAYGVRDYAAIARAILAEGEVTTPATLDDQRAYLVRSAFAWCAMRDEPIAPELAARWLVSEQAALVESALLAIRRAAPDRERPLAEAALARALLPGTTRTFLQDHLRRLDAMTQALEAQRRLGRQ